MPAVKVESVSGKPFQFLMTARQHTSLTDAPVDHKGGDTAATPHELMLWSIAACKGMTIQMFCQRKKWLVGDISVSIKESTVVDPDDKSKKIPHFQVDIETENPLPAEQMDRLREVSKQCPVFLLFTGKKVFEESLQARSTEVASYTAESATGSTAASPNAPVAAPSEGQTPPATSSGA